MGNSVQECLCKITLHYRIVILLTIATITWVLYNRCHRSPSHTNYRSPSHRQNHRHHMDLFTQQKETFFPKYDKELDLFKSMDMNEQQEYLDLTREIKLVKYGSKLL